ncbi:hypothetical protein [Microbacterium laevaniformans]|uniref:hypothetical protein n=1 Tax=Microbacterium laevaniformans TaxID=36807 RepID=UPI00077AEFD9|nr:hypothetical protein [Microbacterium laevaniformans]
MSSRSAPSCAPAAVSALAVRDDLHSGRLVRVEMDGEVITRPVAAVWAGREPEPAASRLLAVIADRLGIG